MSTLEIIQDILAAKFALDRAKLTPEAELSKLGIDSLAVLELLFDIEDRFGLKIKDDMPSSLMTLQDVVLYIDALLRQRQGQEPAVVLSPLECPCVGSLLPGWEWRPPWATVWMSSLRISRPGVPGFASCRRP